MSKFLPLFMRRELKVLIYSGTPIKCVCRVITNGARVGEQWCSRTIAITQIRPLSPSPMLSFPHSIFFATVNSIDCFDDFVHLTMKWQTTNGKVGCDGQSIIIALHFIVDSLHTRNCHHDDAEAICLLHTFDFICVSNALLLDAVEVGRGFCASSHLALHFPHLCFAIATENWARPLKSPRQWV